MAKNQGIQSRNVKRVDQRLGAGAKAIIPAGVAQIGQRQGNHFTEQGRDGRMHSSYGGIDMYSAGRGYNKTPYGNEVAQNTVCGVGGSRTVYSRGTQGVQGNPASGNPPSRGDLFPGWERK